MLPETPDDLAGDAADGGQMIPASLLAAVSAPPPNDGRTWRYDRELAQRIADAVADGLSLHEQRAADPLTVPPVTVLFAWRKQHPEFGLMLTHADIVRADLLREQALQLADRAKGQPARVAIMVGQRMKMADLLAPVSAGGPAQLGATDPQPVAPELSDEQLAGLAAAGLPMNGDRQPA